MAGFMVLENVEDTVEQEIANGATRRDVAETYAFAIRQALAAGYSVDWLRMNLAIMDHWSEAGLVWIQRAAWKRYEDWLIVFGAGGDDG